MRLKVVYSVCNGATGGRSSTYIARGSCSASVLEPSQQRQQHASTTLKACLQAICLTRPDFVPSSSSDYAVSVLDVLESERIFEGKGMMGWLLAEEGQEGTTQVTGRLLDESATRSSAAAAENPAEDIRTLEIVLELVPRQPVNRTDFLSNLSSSQNLSTQQQQPAAAQQSVNAPTPPTNNASTNGNDMLQALSTIMAMNNGTDGNSQANRNFQLLAQMIQMQTNQAAQQQQQQGNSTLLPGINLFNPGRVIQQQRNASLPAPEPVKATTSRAASKKGAAARKDSEGGDVIAASASTLLSSSKKATASQAGGSGRIKHWAPGCLKCGRTESTQWRVRKKRSRPLDGSDAAAPDGQDNEEGVKKLCEECAQDLPSLRKKRAEEEAAAAAAAAAEASTANSDAGASKPRRSIDSSLPTLTYDNTGRARPRATVAVKQHKAAVARQQNATSIQTSPLRRSPRRSVVSNVRQPIGGGRDSLSQPFTSPSRPSNDSEQSGNGLAAKRRKFTTALSAVALREELANSPDAQKLEAPVQPKKRRITPTNLSRSVPAPDRFKSPSFGSASAAAAGAGGDEDDFHFLGASASYCPTTSSKADIEKQKKHAKQIFDTASPKARSGSGRTNSDETMTNFLMNASPGTAIRSLLGETPKLGKLSGGFPNVQDTPGKGLGRYLLEGLALPAGLSSYDLMEMESSSIKDANIDPSLAGAFSPLGTSLSTPFRNAIFQTATSKTPAGPVGPTSPGKRISPRAISEQPPSTHEKLLATLQGPHGPSGLATSQTMHLSSDDTNFGYSATAAAGHPFINLLPPTADRSKSIAASLPMHGSEFTSDMPTSYPDDLLNDFSSFLLKTSSSLLTSPSPPRKTAARPGLAIPGQTGLNGRRHSTPTPLNFAPSSDAFEAEHLDINMADLPPSSPPPLPSTSTSAGTAYQSYLDSFLAGFSGNGAEDTQSPISVGTSATQGGTPQENLPSFTTAPISNQNVTAGKSPFSNGNAYGDRENQSSETSYDVDMTLLAGNNKSIVNGGDESFNILSQLDEGVSMEEDPLLSFFGQQQQQQQQQQPQAGNGKPSNPVVDKLRYSAAAGATSENMALTWSESTASSSSIPDYELVSSRQNIEWQAGKLTKD